MNSLIPWVGGKAKLLWIIDQLAPAHYTGFVDVFGGSGTVTLNRPRHPGCVQVYNDFNRDLCNLLFCAREKTLSLIKELDFLPLQSREEFELLKCFLKGEDFTQEFLGEQLEIAEESFSTEEAAELKALLRGRAEMADVRRAAIYFRLLRFSFNGTGRSFGGRPCSLRSFFHLIWSCSRRLEGVTLENRDFEELIRLYDEEGIWFYCDPPYVKAEKVYDVDFPREDHLRLHRVLGEAKGYVMLSYNDCPLVRELYGDFYIFRTSRHDAMSHKEGQEYGELIITNYDPRRWGCQISLGESVKYSLIHEPEGGKQ